MNHPPARVFPLLMLALLSPIGVLGAEPVADEQAKYFRNVSHYIVEDRQIENELGETPIPFLDWGLIHPGVIVYVNKATGDVLPLSNTHSLKDPNDVRAVPIAVPAGVHIRAQSATRGGSFAQELFEPKFPWEENCTVHTLIHDPADQKYKLWYRTKGQYAYAESKDFKTWDRPLRSYQPYEQSRETNLVGRVNDDIGDIRSTDEARPGGNAFFVDPSAPADERYKCTFLAHVKLPTEEYAKQSGRPVSSMTDPPSSVMFGAVSADGIGWRILPKPIMLHDADTLTVTHYDSSLKRYVMYTRLYELGRRSIGRSETADFSNWPLPTNLLSAGAEQSPSVDYYAPAHAPYPNRDDIRTMLVLVYDRAIDGSQIRLATSRDGHSFKFVPGDAAIRDDSAGFLSAQPSLVRTPDGRMITFCDASRVPHKFPRHQFGGSTQYAAVWPADRLAAIEAPDGGEFSTVDVNLRGNRILLNMQAQRTGGIQVQLRDADYKLIPNRTFAEADVLFGDHQSIAVTWRGDANLAEHRNKKIYINVRLRAAKLFSITAAE